MKTVCIVILNWNRKADLRRLIKSVFRDIDEQPPFGYRFTILLVDNASTDGSVEMVQTEYPTIEIIRNPSNLGGSGGFNTGLHYAIQNNFDFAWLLDNDVEVLPGALKGLITTIELDGRISLVGSKILHRDNPAIVCELGADIHPLTTFPDPRFANVPNSAISVTELDVDYVAICSALIRITTVKRLGCLDEAFFLMWDDMELGVRLRRSGFRVIATNRSSVIHPGFSERTATPSYIYYAWRNHLYFVAVNFKGLRRIAHLCYLSGLLHTKIRRSSKKSTTLPYATALLAANKDFWEGQMGKCTRHFPSFDKQSHFHNVIRCHTQNKLEYKSILIIAERPVSVVKSAIKTLNERVPNSRLIILSSNKRHHLFSWASPNEVWIRKGWVSDMNTCLRILSNGITTTAIFPDCRPPFLSSLTNEIWVISEEGEIITRSNQKLSNAIKVLVENKVDTLLGMIEGLVKTLLLTIGTSNIADILANRNQTLLRGFKSKEDYEPNVSQ